MKTGKSYARLGSVQRATPMQLSQLVEGLNIDENAHSNRKSKFNSILKSKAQDQSFEEMVLNEPAIKLNIKSNVSRNLSNMQHKVSRINFETKEDYLLILSCSDLKIDQRIELFKKPVPYSIGTLQLTIVRKGTGFGKLFPKYYLFDESKSIFLLNSKKKVLGSQTSHYIISSTKDMFSKEDNSYIGKLRKVHSSYSSSAFAEYMIYDSGKNHKRDLQVGMSQCRKQLAYIMYSNETNQLSMTRKIKCIIPEFDANGEMYTFQSIQEDNSLSSQFNQGVRDEIQVFESIIPYWSDANKCLVLNFCPRVKQSSIKNFQIQPETKGRKTHEVEDVCIEFGRISKSEFCLNVKYPFSIMSAFGIALTSFDI